MEQVKLDFFKTELLLKREEIVKEAGKTLKEMGHSSNNVPDPNDRATLESGRNFELRIRHRERRLIDKIDEALLRIEDGSFGICEECGNRIGIKRLEARPVTTLCIDCKTVEENEEKAHGQ